MRGWFLTILFGGDGPDGAVATLPEQVPSNGGGRFSFRGLGSALSENCGVKAAVGGLKSFRGGIHSETEIRDTSSKDSDEMRQAWSYNLSSPLSLCCLVQYRILAHLLDNRCYMYIFQQSWP